MPGFVAKDSPVIAVVGLGVVGIPVACAFARAGFTVRGVDVNVGRVSALNAGRYPLEGREPGLPELVAEVVKSGKFSASSDAASALEGAEFVLVAVQTPFDHATKSPNYAPLASALANVGAHLAPGALVVVESTLAPGTTLGVVIPALEAASGKRAGVDFDVAHVPERVTPGRLLKQLTEWPRVIGGATPRAGERCLALYKHVVKGALDVSDATTAEIVKTGENTYRDVQIAFANELALVCEHLGADAWRVRELMNKDPARNVHKPGAGVGGHCIPKDPWLLMHGVRDVFTPSTILHARKLNDSMPDHMHALVKAALAEAGRALKNATVTLLGVAYLEDTDDIRESPATPLLARLAADGVRVRLHDPYVKKFENRTVSHDLVESLAGADCAVIVTAHDAYTPFPFAQAKVGMATLALVDGRGVATPAEAAEHGFTFRGVGRGSPPTPPSRE